MRYEDRIVEEVQSLNDIVEVISGYIPLRRAGKSFKAVCPFHQEKTPSFIVNAERQIFHCFGCGAGGDVYSFLMKYENLTFPEALRQLAERVHVTLPEKSTGKEENSIAGKLFEINEAAFQYYRKNFENKEIGRPAREYMQKRGFELTALEESGVGYALSDWRGLYDHLSRRGFPEDLMIKSGLILRAAQGNCYDLLRGRVIFPIRNAQGKTVAFGGRIMTDELPKYINSPETEIFRKRREFFGLNTAKRFIPADNPSIFVVEGYLDQIRLDLGGFRNTVATLGTALTEDHVRVLKRYVSEAVLVYDGDKAGEAASLRGLEIFLQEGLLVKLLSLPQGKDPDQLIREEGAEAFRKLAANAQDIFDFKLASLLKKYNRNDSLGLLRITGEFLETFAHVRNEVLLDQYINRLSMVLGVQSDSIRRELDKLRAKLARPEGPEKGGEPQKEKKEGGAENDEFILLSVLFSDPALIEKVQEELSAEDFLDPGARQVFSLLGELNRSGRKVTLTSVLDRGDDERLKSRLRESSFFDMDEISRHKAVDDCIRSMRQKKIKKNLNDLQLKIREAESRGRGEQVLEYMKEYQALMARMK